VIESDVGPISLRKVDEQFTQGLLARADEVIE
jgi:hypothetical protein